MSIQQAGSQHRSGAAGGPAGALATLALWRQRSRSRAAMAGFDDRMLKDLGLGYSDARREARKWFWQA